MNELTALKHSIDRWQLEIDLITEDTPSIVMWGIIKIKYGVS